uniref:Heterogeneous nuclear ribonucleoprotein K-like n=1 Tax=Phallusia mammillata TaxID=59560 RepID=A0A6F9DFD7_9ASCI|nr:heterogeneous nuclear ribonucleoprotein K-like [Phallusia mammillata]
MLTKVLCCTCMPNHVNPVTLLSSHLDPDPGTCTMTEFREGTKYYSPPDAHTKGGNNALTAQPSIRPCTKRNYPLSYQVDECHNASKRFRPQDIEMRCLVPAKTAGGIIGKGGNNIKDMRATFRAQIQLPDAQAPHRIFRATAGLETLGEIVFRVVPIIHENNAGFQERDQMSLKLLIHHSQAGGIIGPKGFKINGLREKTGAQIKMHQECLPNSTDRTCQVSGTPEVISKCVVLILEMLQSLPINGTVNNFNPASTDLYDNAHSSHCQMGHFGGGRGRLGRGFGQMGHRFTSRGRLNSNRPFPKNQFNRGSVRVPNFRTRPNRGH